MRLALCSALILSLPLGLALGSPAQAQQIMKHEPPRGELHSGQYVLVDNGRCPKGQLLKVTAGVSAGGGRANSHMRGMPRQRSCVPRPR